MDGGSGDQVVIGAENVIDDDLYGAVQVFTRVSFVRNSITLILVGLFLLWLWDASES